jgi:hypothetical protein
MSLEPRLVTRDMLGALLAALMAIYIDLFLVDIEQ